MKSLYTYFLAIFLLLLPSVASTQEEAPEINLSLYCSSEVPASFKIGVTDDLKIGFTATFEGQSPAKSMNLFFVDGHVDTGKVQEQKITKLKCKSGDSENTNVCTGSISIEKEARLAEKFSFDQEVINLSFRKGKDKKDYCLGKFTNDEALIVSNSRAKRTLCNFIPTTEDSTVSGVGHFNPEGYGTEGDAHFHLSLSGLPVETQLRGCAVTGADRYREAFTFESYDGSTTDSQIYGDLDEEEQAEFDSNKIDYSYDLVRDLFSDSDNLDQITFIPNLSNINFGISQPSAKKSTSKANKKRARKRRRRKKKNSQRDLSPYSTDRAQIAANSTEDVFKWLSFDPNAGVQIYIAESCKGDVLSNAYGKVVCGQSDEIPSDTRKCVSMTGDQGEATGCIEPKDGYTLASVRVKDISNGEYTVCFDTKAVTQKLTVATDSNGEFGLIEITDSETLKTSMSELALYTEGFDGISTIGLSSTADCSDIVLSGSFVE